MEISVKSVLAFVVQAGIFASLGAAVGVSLSESTLAEFRLDRDRCEAVPLDEAKMYALQENGDRDSGRDARLDEFAVDARKNAFLLASRHGPGDEAVNRYIAFADLPGHGLSPVDQNRKPLPAWLEQQTAMMQGCSEEYGTNFAVFKFFLAAW